MNVIDRKFEEWWKSIVFNNDFTQAKDYSLAAFRAGYIAMQEIASSNSSVALLSGEVESDEIDREIAAMSPEEIAKAIEESAGMWKDRDDLEEPE